MDRILSCLSCRHTIGDHSADGCQRQLSSRVACDCPFDPRAVVDQTLAVDEERRNRLLGAMGKVFAR